MAIKTEPVEAPLPALPVQDQTMKDAKAHAKAVLAAELQLQYPKTAPEPPAAAKKAATKAMWDHRKATAWAVHRWPYEKRIVQEKTRVYLPRSYGSKGGEDVMTVWPGECMNQKVYAWYAKAAGADEEAKEEGKGKKVKFEESKQGSTERGANYVAEDGITARRCAPIPYCLCIH